MQAAAATAAAAATPPAGPAARVQLVQAGMTPVQLRSRAIRYIVPNNSTGRVAGPATTSRMAPPTSPWLAPGLCTSVSSVTMLLTPSWVGWKGAAMFNKNKFKLLRLLALPFGWRDDVCSGSLRDGGAAGAKCPAACHLCLAGIPCPFFCDFGHPGLSCAPVPTAACHPHHHKGLHHPSTALSRIAATHPLHRPSFSPLWLG